MSWDPENNQFWNNYGKKIAYKNLWASVVVLTVAFMAWMVWSSYVVYLQDIRKDFSSTQLYWLTAFPLISAGILRIFYSFAISIVGGKNFVFLSTAIILLPMSMLLYASYNPNVSYVYYALCSFLTGLPGANFASSSANISYFFPHRLKGIALGINAAIGNMGVGIIQLIAPWIILFQLPISLKQNIYYIENIPFLIIVLTIFSCFIIYNFMDNLEITKSNFKDQLSILSDKHNWIMCILYSTTFGSFIGLASVFPIILSTQFNNNDSIKFSFIGALLSSLMRPVGHILSKHIGSVYTTLLTFIILIVAMGTTISFLPSKSYSGSLEGVIASFLILFLGTGIGKGSTTAMIPDIYSILYRKKMINHKEEAQVQYIKSLQDTATVLGFTSAIATIAAFFIPNLLSTSEYIFNNIEVAMYLFIVFYVFSFMVATFYYLRESDKNPFFAKDIASMKLIDTPTKQELYFSKINKTNIKKVA